ncbi:MAG: homocysteine S-methyltransferase family protein [Candidatus Latescibacterota bacterium]
MSDFLAALEEGPVLADGATGSYLFEQTGRLSEANHVYEAFSADHPELILQVHLAYLQAGARCLTTNTFGANLAVLAPVGQAHRVEELNRAAVRVARRAIGDYCQHSGASSRHFVLGSVGPPLDPTEAAARLPGLYAAQLRALLDEGVDALILETFTSLAHVEALLQQARALDPRVPVVVHMALHQVAGAWSQEPRRLVETAANSGARVVGVNCCAPWEAQAFLEAVAEVPPVRQRQVLLSCMPNGGEFRRIGNRYLTGVNPELMGRFARQAASRGVRLVGGCCEVHPPHIREMHGYLRSRGEEAVRVAFVPAAAALAPVEDAVKRENGPFSRKVMDGEFAVSVEVLPPRGTGGLKAKVDFVGELAASGLADALDLTDGSRGIPLMPPGDFAGLIREKLGWREIDPLEVIPHFTARDLNVMGLQSRLIGYWARRIHNVLFVTGDPPKMSPTYPRSTAVFDLDSVALIRYAHAFLNAGVDFGGQPLGPQRDPRTHFTIGSGFEPEAVDRTRELERLRRKLDSGVDYIMTQPAFRPEPLAALEEFRGRTAVLVGVLILTSLAHAQRMAQVPGVIVPPGVFARLERYESLEDQGRAGQEIAALQIRWVRQSGWAGLYLMSPANPRPALEVLSQALA